MKKNKIITYSDTGDISLTNREIKNLKLSELKNEIKSYETGQASWLNWSKPTRNKIIKEYTKRFKRVPIRHEYIKIREIFEKCQR